MEIFCVFVRLHLLMLEDSFMELKMELEWLTVSLFQTKVAIFPEICQTQTTRVCHLTNY